MFLPAAPNFSTPGRRRKLWRLRAQDRPPDMNGSIAAMSRDLERRAHFGAGYNDDWPVTNGSGNWQIAKMSDLKVLAKLLPRTSSKNE